MTTKTNTYHIEVRGLPIEVTRKDIKNFYIGVHPPNGQIRVSAPLRLDDDAIRMAIISRLGWIRREQAAFAKQERQSQREFVTGESHYFAGKRYRLDVTERDCPPKVHLLNNTRIALTVRPGHRSGQKGGDISCVVSRTSPIAVASTSHQVATKDGRDRQRSVHQENENALGFL